jgi:hypothetical protein
MVIFSPLGATAFWYAIVLRLEREITGARNYLNHSSPKNRAGANDDLGLEPMIPAGRQNPGSMMPMH